MLTLVKGLPTGYNRDLQDDRQAVLDTGPLVRGAVRAGARRDRSPHVRSRALPRGGLRRLDAGDRHRRGARAQGHAVPRGVQGDGPARASRARAKASTSRSSPLDGREGDSPGVRRRRARRRSIRASPSPRRRAAAARRPSASKSRSAGCAAATELGYKAASVPSLDDSSPRGRSRSDLTARHGPTCHAKRRVANGHARGHRPALSSHPRDRGRRHGWHRRGRARRHT